MIRKIYSLALVAFMFFGIRDSLAHEIVFENITTYTGKFFASTNEFGDQIFLGGLERTVTEFAFEYYGGFTAGGDETGRLRFYSHNGPETSPGFPDSRMPGTLLYDSGLFPINPGFNSKGLVGLDVPVPDTFTWTIQFGGVTGANDDHVGLLFYNPPTIGSSYDDFWFRTGASTTNWILLQDDSVKDNFAARVEAYGTTLHTNKILSVVLTSSGVEVTATASVGRHYALEYSADGGATWKTLPAAVKAQGITVLLRDRDAISLSRLYRIAVLDVPKIQTLTRADGKTTISVQSQVGRRYAVDYKSSIADPDWFRLGTFPDVGNGGVISFVDQSTATAPKRFYRVALVL